MAFQACQGYFGARQKQGNNAVTYVRIASTHLALPMFGTTMTLGQTLVLTLVPTLKQEPLTGMTVSFSTHPEVLNPLMVVRERPREGNFVAMLGGVLKNQVRLFPLGYTTTAPPIQYLFFYLI